MGNPLPTSLALIAGKGAYPRLLAESAKAQGVQRLVAIAFRRETDPVIARIADETRWVHIGQLGAFLEALRAAAVRHAVMAGQITPTHLFRLRMDRPMFDLLRGLPKRNAETIFGAVAEAMRGVGVELLPASTFMEPHMPQAGQLTARAPTEREQQDIALGLEVARATSGLDIGQTVVIKEGTILAVEAFEGTDAAIRRAGELGGKGAVVVKVAKQTHDMRFDIPVIGERTVRVLRKIRAGALAVEAGRAILLERDKVIAQLNALDVAFVALAPPPAAAGSARGEAT